MDNVCYLSYSIMSLHWLFLLSLLHTLQCIFGSHFTRKANIKLFSFIILKLCVASEQVFTPFLLQHLFTRSLRSHYLPLSYLTVSMTFVEGSATSAFSFELSLKDCLCYLNPFSYFIQSQGFKDQLYYSSFIFFSSRLNLTSKLQSNIFK